MEIAVKTSVITIIIICLLLVCIITAQVFNTINVVYDATSEAILSQVTINAPGAFAGFRESSGTARAFDGEAWTYSIDDNEVLAHITQLFSLDDTGTRYNGEIKQFKISNVKTHGVNVEGSNITFTATVDVIVPIHFAGRNLGNISKNLKVKAIYDKRY